MYPFDESELEFWGFVFPFFSSVFLENKQGRKAQFFLFGLLSRSSRVAFRGASEDDWKSD